MPATDTLTPESLVAHCRERGVSIQIRGGIITLHKTFTPGSNEGYTEAETDCSIIYSIPYRCGSIFGTTGDSVGGLVGLKGGYMTINVTGVMKRFIAKLQKMI
jgi:hypothetical protein